MTDRIINGQPHRQDPWDGSMQPMPSPNPGSDEAIAQGCKCPVLDNGHGRGYMGQPGIFVMTASCPIHGQKTEPQP